MKKILTVSLFAIMAVGAANADIASTTYVDNKVSTGVANKADKATTLGGYGIIDAYTKTQIDSTVGTLATKTELAGYATDDELSAVSAVANAAQTATQVGTAIDDKISALKLGETYQTKANLSTEIPETNASDEKYTSESAVAEYVDVKMGALSGNVGQISTSINNLSGRVTTTETDIQTLKTADTNINGKIGTANMGTTATTLTGAIAEVKGIADAAQTETEVKTLITDNAINSVATGSTNGTILVDNQSVAVKGLGSAAYTNSDAYAVKGTETTAANNATAISTIKENLGALDVKIPDLPDNTNMYSLVADKGVIKWEKVDTGTN